MCAMYYHVLSYSTYELAIRFALPPTEPHFRAQPDAYLSYLFSDATNVSLRAAVKEANLATGVSAWVFWAANKRFEISKFKFKFPRARTFELFRARSRLYRSQILQVNTRWKALAEIYTMHSFAPF